MNVAFPGIGFFADEIKLKMRSSGVPYSNTTAVFIRRGDRDTQGKDHHVTIEAKIGMMHFQAK